jgi:hypothetical protein
MSNQPFHWDDPMPLDEAKARLRDFVSIARHSQEGRMATAVLSRLDKLEQELATIQQRAFYMAREVPGTTPFGRGMRAAGKAIAGHIPWPPEYVPKEAG